MAVFKFHSPETAPHGSQKLLQELLNISGSNGFYSVISESPEALKAYKSLHNLFSQTSFSNEERTVIWQTINVENECIFCVPAHTSMAKKMNVSNVINEALRNETPLPNKKLESLRTFTTLLLRNRGNVSDKEILSFLHAGYSNQNILEIIIGLAQKTISNYVNHVARTPVEKQYEKFSWKRKKNK